MMTAAVHPAHADAVSDPSRRGAMDALLGVLARCRATALGIAPDLYLRDVEMRDSIGTHLRHCLDHAAALDRGLAWGVIDYDRRERNASIERAPALFVAALDAVMDSLRRHEGDPGSVVALRTMIGCEGSSIIVHTTAAREMAFVASHAIHHLAIIRHVARGFGAELPERFDLAFSTEAHLKKSPPAGGA